MKDRRDFLKKSALVAAGLAVSGPGRVYAYRDNASFPAGVVYTKDQPGMWSAKVGGHAPQVQVDGQKVTVTTNHPMTEEHFIVRHTIVSPEGVVLGAKTFYPSDGKAVSTYELPPDHDPVLYATSFCNKHDLWLTEFKA
jgi:superoxide reductase